MYPITDSEKGREILARYKEWQQDQEQVTLSSNEYIEYLRELRIQQFHGNHDQSTHGNWARGGSAVPVEERKVLRNLDPDVRGIVQELLTARRRAEPRYTETLSRIAEQHSGEMYGLAFKFKKAEGIAEKIDRKVKAKGISAKESAESIGDALRYTIAFEPDNYVEGTRAAIKALLDQGVKFESIEDNWQKGDAYNGINVSMIDPDTGLRMELQFHTPDSFDVKDRVIHKDYEAYRTGQGTRQQRWAMANRMQKQSDAVEFPENIGSDVEGIPVTRVYRPHTEPITAAARDQGRVPVSTLDRMEDLYAKGIASQDDWEEYIDYFFGYTSFWPGYIYPNLAVEDDIQPQLSASKYVEYLRAKVETFHLPGQHDQSTHGDWASPSTQADPLGDQIASEIAEQRAQRGQKPLSPGSMKVYVSKERSRRKALGELEKVIEANKTATQSPSKTLTNAEAAVAGQMPRKEVGAAVRAAFESINAVHGLPDDIVPIPIRTNRQVKAQAQYAYRETAASFGGVPGARELPVSIEVNPDKSEHMALSFTHEFGHYIESSVTGRLENDTSPAAKNLLKAMVESKAYNNLIQLALRKDTRHVIRQRAEYYQTPHETFARAYAQWIGLRSGDKKLKQEANDVLTATKPGYDLEVYNYSQWYPTDFEPIAKAMDEYFKEKGLLR